MAISAADISGLPDYTDAQLLKLYKWALANNAAGMSRTINGRSITFPSAPEIRNTIDWLETRVNATTNGTGGNMALGAFGDVQ